MGLIFQHGDWSFLSSEDNESAFSAICTAKYNLLAAKVRIQLERLNREQSRPVSNY